MRRSSWLVLILTPCLLFLCSCSREADEGRSISIACTYSPVDIGSQTMARSIDQFQDMHPEIRIKKLWIPGANYQTKLLTMIAGDSAPDIFRVDPNLVPGFVSKGVLLPLDDYLNESKLLKKDDFFPLLLFKYRFDGSMSGKGPIYGLGTDWSPDSNLFYNKDMFSREGIPYPTESLSWDEFLDIAKRLTKKDDIGRVTQFGCHVSAADLFIYQNGGRVFSEDGKTCLLDTPESIGGIQFFVDLLREHEVMPSSQDRETQNTREMFCTGRIGMLFGGRHLAAILLPIVKDFEWAVGPSIHNKKRVNIMPGPFGWVISNRTKYPEDAWALVEHLVGGGGGVELAKAGYNIPVLKSIAYSDAFLDNPEHPTGLNKTFLDELPYTVSTEVSPYIAFHRSEQLMQDEIQLAILGRQSAEEAGRNAAKKINKIIQKNSAGR